MLKIVFITSSLLYANLIFSQCSPVIDLPFNGNANDVSGNANHGTASGTPTLVPNRFGTANSAYRFGGVGDVDYFTVNHTSSMNLTHKLSISFWFRQCDFSGMDGWGATVSRGYHIVWAKKGDGISVLAGLYSGLSSSASNTLFNGLTNTNGSGYGSYTVNFSNSNSFNCFDTCEWIHVVQVIDSNKQRFYFNGVLQQETTISVANFSTANTHSLLIGKMDGTWYPFRGDIDEFKYYTCAINQATINSLYNGYTDPKQANNIIRLDSTKVQMTTCTNQSLSLYANSMAGPFQYSKDSGITWQTSNVFTGLSPNTYKMSIKSSCNRKDTTIIIQPCQFDLDVSGTFSFCSSPVNIASNLVISNLDASTTLDGAKVYIDTNYISSEDTLLVTTNFGISSNFNKTTGVLSLTGTASKSQYETVLKSIQYLNLAANKTLTTKRVQFVLGNGLYNTNNGHFYRLVNHGSPITWTNARNAAAVSTHFGKQGYLATITDSIENNFIFNLFNTHVWVGGSDSLSEGVWRWVTGCEGLEDTGKGRKFFLASGACNTAPGSGSSFNSSYINWNTNQPDDGGTCVEEYLQFVGGTNGKWNDLPNDPFAHWGNSYFVQYYIIEYGCMPNDPVIDISGNVIVNVVNCPNNLCSDTSINIAQDAVWESNTCIRLTTNQISKVGNITYKNTINLNQSFDKSVNLNFGNLDGSGADGISIILQNQSPIYNGTASFNVGTNTNTGQLKIEFDTWQNNGSSGDPFGDPSYDHIAILKNGDKDHTNSNNIAGPVQASASSGNIEDGNNHLVRIQWIAGGMDSLKIHFDGILRLAIKNNIIANFFSNNPVVYFTVSGSTGGLGNVQKVCNSDFIFKRDTTITRSICQGDSFLGKKISGIYKDTILSSNGCDSIRTLNLTVNPRTSSTITHTICQGDSFIGRKVSGTFIDTLKNANSKGCDSIRTLNLTVNPRTSSIIFQTICQGDSFLGRKISGIFIDTLKNANSKGCDSIRTFNLTVNPRTSSTINKSICQGDSFLGRKLTGTYIDTLRNANSIGCDSIRTLNLTMSGTKFHSFSIVKCQGQFYFFKGTNRFNSGIYRDTIKIGSGCDSVAELNLIIQSPITLISDTSSCDSFSFKSRKYYTNSVLRDTIKSNFGCDSVYKTINLKIFKPTKGQNDSIVTCEKAIYQGSNFYRDTIFSANIPKTIFPFCDSIIKLAKIKIHPLPTVKIFALPDTFIKFGEKITLRATGGQSYLWNYNSSNQAIIESIITDKTYFEVKVTDNNLCEKIAGLWIYVNPEVEIIDVFSPNADGRNDNFAPNFKGDVTVLSFKIYNRWGQIIYQTSDQNPSWDGRFKGEIQPQGSYVYMLEYLAKGQKFSKTGAITLIH